MGMKNATAAEIKTSENVTRTSRTESPGERGAASNRHKCISGVGEGYFESLSHDRRISGTWVLPIGECDNIRTLASWAPVEKNLGERICRASRGDYPPNFFSGGFSNNYELVFTELKYRLFCNCKRLRMEEKQGYFLNWVFGMRISNG